MCSVVGCDSGSRSVQRFKLPEDPERRLEWVQFLLEVNGQRLKESRWTDISICSEHFIHDCFQNMFSATGVAQLKTGAVPSLFIKSEPEECLDRTQAESVEKTGASHQSDDLNKFSKVSPASSDVKNSVAPESGQMRHKNKIDINKEKATLQQAKGKVVVNESCLLQLFRRKCPVCGCKLWTEKLTYGSLIVFNQQCLQCPYTNQWKSQVNTTIPTADRQCLTGGPQQETDGNHNGADFSEIFTFSDEDSVTSDEDEDSEDDGVSSDGEWNPTGDLLSAEKLSKEFEDTDSEGKEEKDFDLPLGLKVKELCTECGCFFKIHKPHKCEHKIKPHSCTICGKRCVTETSLRIHSRIHDDTYEYPCKYCNISFKTRVDKRNHEQIHEDDEDPYECPDCPDTFASNRERSIHLADHRASREFKCGVCGVGFKLLNHLQRHSLVHTGQKPYKCSVCQRAFKQGSHLKSHMRLHTGERPYKCPHCDHSFNHNVSLKSHIQRYHMSEAGSEWTQENRSGSSTGDATVDKSGTDSEYDIVVERDTEEKVQQETTDWPKNKRSSGRPLGRPKRDAEAKSLLAGGKKGRRTNSKSRKSKVQKIKETSSSDEKIVDEQSDSDVCFDSAAEEKATARKHIRRSKGRTKHNSDSDFDPEETQKKKYKIQRSDQGSGKGRGRPKKNQTE